MSTVTGNDTGAAVGVSNSPETLSRALETAKGALAAVRPIPQDPAAVAAVAGAADVFARVLLSGCGEPGDGLLGHVVGVIGPGAAVQTLCAPDPATALHAAMADAADPLESEAAVLAVQRWRPRLDCGRAIRAIRAGAALGVRLLVPGDVAWPTALHDLGPHAPITLWVRGDPAQIRDQRRCIAVVGSRAASGYGEHVTAELVGGLADRGFVVVSGGAYGIDGAAHRAALAGKGGTAALLAGGVNRLYPAGHARLLTEIARTGALVAELRCDESPTKWRFLQRNRLIAALSVAVVVVEAGHRSGALNTAGHAAKLGRPLGAVPGSVLSASSAGCHRLFREYGAECVTNVEDVIELCGFPMTAVPVNSPLSEGMARTLDALIANRSRSIEEIVWRTGLAPAEAIAALGRLAAIGQARDAGSGWVAVPAAAALRTA